MRNWFQTFAFKCNLYRYSEEIQLGDLEEIGELFLDAKASAKLLSEQADKYLS
jgi:DNA helicase TIP49 (TBP-interacting protein)